MGADGTNRQAHLSQEERNLLIEIARCPVVQYCLDHPRRDHPCAEIVRSQRALTVADFQVPEPWSGPIGSAPILFVSSNPSISRSDPPSDRDEEYPTGFQPIWPDERLVDFFNGRFGGGREEWIRNGIRCRMKNGEFPRAFVKFWAAAKGRADEAFGRPAVPGRDYAMTEVVRCKSVREVGVASAACHCPDRYLDRTLRVAGAKLIVGFGKHARNELQSRYQLPTDRPLVGPIEIAGRLRCVTFLSHPAAFGGEKRLMDVLSEDDFDTLRKCLDGA